MSAQRRSSGTNRRARGRAASSRTQASTATLEPVVKSPAAATSSVAAQPERPRLAGRSAEDARQGSERTRGQRADQGGNALRGRFTGIERYLKDTRAELRRVTWPDQQTVRNLTAVVVGVSIAMGLLLGGIDFVLYKLFAAL